MYAVKLSNRIFFILFGFAEKKNKEEHRFGFSNIPLRLVRIIASDITCLLVFPKGTVHI